MFQVGDRVIHRTYGPGQIIQVEDKQVASVTVRYYRVQVKDLTIWVPLAEAEAQRLRNPTPAGEFKKLIKILGKGGEPLAEDRLQRKAQSLGRLQEGRIESTCAVIRDLACFKKQKKLSESDTMILERAQKFLLDEWVISLNTTMADAQQSMGKLLEESQAVA